MTKDQLVRRFVMTLPGMFEAADAMACYRAAYDKANLSAHMSVSEFAAALDRMGHRPFPVRDKHRLALPEAGPGVRARGAT